MLPGDEDSEPDEPEPSRLVGKFWFATSSTSNMYSRDGLGVEEGSWCSAFEPVEEGGANKDRRISGEREGSGGNLMSSCADLAMTSESQD